MKKSDRLFLLLAVLVLSLALLTACHTNSTTDKTASLGDAADKTGKTENGENRITPLYEVKRIIDGDTIVIDYKGKDEKVRFLGIDAPETNDTLPYGDTGKTLGKLSTEYLTQRLNSQAEGRPLVGLEEGTKTDSRDVYGRMLRFVLLPDGTNLCIDLVSKGYALSYRRYHGVNAELIKAAEARALSENIGYARAIKAEKGR